MFVAGCQPSTGPSAGLLAHNRLQLPVQPCPGHSTSHTLARSTMRLSSPLFRSICVLLSISPLLSCHSNVRESLKAASFDGPVAWPIVLADYQPWFGEKNHLDVGYSSNDPIVLRKQIQHAKDMGITAFAVNWYGPGKQPEDRNYALLQQIALDNTFKVALLYDEATQTPGSATDAVIEDLQYAYDHYLGPRAGPVSQAYLRYNGRPVIFVFPKESGTDWDQVHQAVNSWPEDDRPLLIYKDFNERYARDFDGFYAWVNPGKEGWAADGSHWGEAYLGNYYRTMTSKYPDKIAVGAAWPGFDDSRASWSMNRHISPRCGKTFEETLRMFRKYYNNTSPLPFLMIETWNDYEEGTAIEKGLPRC